MFAWDMQMKIVFNVYKAFTSQLSQEECRLYAYKILFPLYKVCEGFTGKIISGIIGFCVFPLDSTLFLCHKCNQEFICCTR